MVQSVKSHLQLLFAVISLTALVLMTMGASPPLKNFSANEKAVVKICPLVAQAEGKSSSCEAKTRARSGNRNATLTGNSAYTN